ncbi:hypothetical protein FQS90_03025 [Enterococcus casseliflavus]|nr:hypothetical protein [Enterococcus casseliflavus]MBO1144176.1 hypothetical protein [Enterococcus casseliflavus]
MRELPLKDNLTILTAPTENNLCILSKEKATIKIFEEDIIIHTFENELFEQKEIKILFTYLIKLCAVLKK